MSEPEEARRGSVEQRRRSRSKGRSRPYRIAISVDQAERDELEATAGSEGLTVSAFVAYKAITAARNILPPAVGPLREALTEIVRAIVQVQKVGVNLNQAVAALNATGEDPGNLIQYARYTAVVIDRLDQIAARISERLP